jgi:peptide/nickel transport system substrate-binding protein
MFETIKWHDGSPLSVADFVMGMIMTFDPTKPESKIYDESRAPNLESFLTTFKGFKVTSTSPLTIEFYSDTYALDAELNVADWWPNYGYGEAPWHSIVAGNLAEENGEIAYSADKADAAEVEWTSFIDGPSMAILENYLTQAATPAEEGGPVYLPYAPTMSQFVTQEEAVARYANLAKWYNLNNHFWVGTGPYFLDKVSSVEKILTLRYNEMYPDLATRWLTFSEPKIAVAEVSGPTEVVIGEEAKFDVTVTFKDAPYPAAEITSVKFLIFDATGVLVADGLAELVSDGSYTVTLTAEQSAALTAGATKLEVAVVPLLVSLPTFATYEFITVAP